MKILRHRAHLTVIGEERLLSQTEAFVMICNHGMWHMPIAAVLNLKTPFRPWIHDVMLQRESCQIELNKMLAKSPQLSSRIKKNISTYGAKLVCRILNDFEPIAVKRGHSREALKSLQNSIEALMNGDNLLIFPETPRCSGKDIVQEVKMADNLRQLYTGFAQLGRLYFKRSGKCLKFFPLYIDREKETLRVGEPVCYEYLGNAIDEKRRISKALYESLQELSTA